jgi:amino acid permease
VSPSENHDASASKLLVIVLCCMSLVIATGTMIDDPSIAVFALSIGSALCATVSLMLAWHIKVR